MKFTIRSVKIICCIYFVNSILSKILLHFYRNYEIFIKIFYFHSTECIIALFRFDGIMP